MATNVATLSDLRAPVQVAPVPSVRAGFFDAAGFELMQRVAKAFAQSTLVPQAYAGSVANCMIAINMAERIGADPMMVMQNLYIVHGRPGWSAQFLIATFNHCGRFTALRYEWTGDRTKDSWGCRAWATEKDTGDKIIGPEITIGLSKAEGWYGKSGSKWQTIPELMLMYRAAAWMIRTYAPEIAMGLQSAEEIGDVFDASQGGDGAFTVDVAGMRAELAQAKGNSEPPKAAGQQQPPASPAEPGDQEPPNKAAPERPNRATGEVSGPAPTFAAVALRIEVAQTVDAVNDARTLIPDVADPAHQTTLRTKADKREQELRADDGK